MHRKPLWFAAALLVLLAGFAHAQEPQDARGIELPRIMQGLLDTYNASASDIEMGCKSDNETSAPGDLLTCTYTVDPACTVKFTLVRVEGDRFRVENQREDGEGCEVRRLRRVPDFSPSLEANRFFEAFNTQNWSAIIASFRSDIVESGNLEGLGQQFSKGYLQPYGRAQTNTVRGSKKLDSGCHAMLVDANLERINMEWKMAFCLEDSVWKLVDLTWVVPNAEMLIYRVRHVYLKEGAPAFKAKACQPLGKSANSSVRCGFVLNDERCKLEIRGRTVERKGGREFEVESFDYHRSCKKYLRKG